MTFKCERNCQNKSSYGYCLTTYCIHPSPVPNITYEAVTPPSRICTVCEEFEYKNAAIGKGDFWLCNKCLGKLKKLLSEGVKE